MELEIVGNSFKVLCCPRCDEEHAELEFQALSSEVTTDSALDPYVGDFWARCPVSGEWLLLRSDKLPDGRYELMFDFSKPS